MKRPAVKRITLAKPVPIRRGIALSRISGRPVATRLGRPAWEKEPYS